MCRTLQLLALCVFAKLAHAGAPFGIHVVDESTGRGVPLVELRSVDGQLWVTDSAGWIAFEEPGIMGKEVFFSIKSHGYEYPKDGFGMTGVRLVTNAGGRETVKLRRINLAERLYRQTGRGIYRDSALLGEPVPLKDGQHAGMVAGQDSAQVAAYKGRLLWLWGDTSRMSYPLGNFRTSGAWSDFPSKGGLPAVTGVNLSYLVDKSGFSRAVAPLPDKAGVVWMDGLCAVPDEQGAQKLLARYQRRQGLGKLYEQGISVFRDDREEFEPVAKLSNDEKWRSLHGHVTAGRGDGFLYMGVAGLSVRVEARYANALDSAKYEAWTCAGPDGEPLRKPDGSLDYAWRKDAGPVESIHEAAWVKAGKIRAEEARMLPVDILTGERVRIHAGTVRWNEHRKKWVMVGVQYEGKPSFLGEVWYAESQEPTGPWRKAIRIVTHDRYSFYNPVHHTFFDDGRYLYFEGTYTKEFSGNPEPTPRYDYNQVMYRLDLDDPRMDAVRR